MAKQQGQVTKIYQLKTLGYDDISKQLDNINKKFDAIKKTKLAAEGKLIASKDIKDVEKYSEEVAQLVVEEQRLRVERQKMQNEQKAGNIARQEEIRLQKEKLRNNLAESGSIVELRNRIKELNALVIRKNQSGTTGLISFEGQNLSIDQATAKLRQLIATEQDFRRQFQKDGTLVAEYTTGIVQAFKQMGLDDLVAGQVTRAKDQLNSLNNGFNTLQKELQETRAAGKSTETIEQQMIENRNEVIKLDTALARLKTDLRGTGDVGNQITTSIGNGFKSLKGQIGGFILSFVGVQALINGIQKSFTDTIALDSLDQSLAAVSLTTEELAINQKFLAETTDRLGLSVLDTSVAYKNFYAASTQAGISTDQTREIFLAAASASSNLKLSQEQTNGVLLAFGQIASKGKVQAEELRGQIGERIPGAFSIAARSIGVTQAQLNKMLEKGEVIASEFLPKFAAELQKTFGVDSNKRVVGLQASVNRLKNEFTELLQNNQAGLSAFFSILIEGAGILIKLLPVIILSLALYSAEVLRAYVVTQLSTKGTVLWTLALYAQRAAIFVANVFLTAYYGTILLFTGGMFRATAATTLFSNVLRGIPLGAVLTVIGLIVGAFVAFGRTVAGTTAALSENARRQLALMDVQREANKIATEQIAKINSWVAVIKSSTSSIDTQKRAVQELTKINSQFSTVVKDNVIDLKELEKVYGDVTNAIILQAKAQASAQLTAKKQQKTVNLQVLRQELEIATARGGDFVLNTKNTDLPDEIVELLKTLKGVTTVRNLDLSQNIAVTQEDIKTVLQDLAVKEGAAQKEFVDYLSIKEKADKDLEDFIKTGATDATAFEVDIKALKQKLDDIDKEINAFQGSKADLKAKVAERDKLQKQLDDLLNKNQKKPTASRLSAEQKDAFKDIDAVRDRLNAVDEQRRQESLIGEEQYLDLILANNLSAINQKLKVLKGANAEERKQIAELNLDKIKLEGETNNKLFDIKSKALRKQLDQQIADIRLQSAVIENDPSLSETDRAEAKLKADQDILALQVKFNADIDALEKQLKQNSITNAEETADALRKTKEQILIDERAIYDAQLKDINIAGEKQRARFVANYEQLRTAILNNDKLTAKQRKQALEKLARQQDFTILSSELAQLTIEFEKIEALYKKNLISETEFLSKKAELEKKRSDQAGARGALQKANIDLPSETNSQNLLRERLSKEFGFGEGSAEDQLLGNVLAESFNLAQDAMNSYFDAEEQRIQDSLQIQLDRIDLEKEQVLSRAQSQDEIASIEKQYELKKKKAQKEAGEQLKKSKKAEAKVALSTELANIAASAAGNPANAFTFGAAGAVMYAILAGLAFGRYGLRVAEINREQFAFGGKPGEVPVRGGEFGGNSHSKGGTDFDFNGKNYNAEAKELAVIRTRNAIKGKKYAVSGTQMEIASFANKIGGGKNFKPGAKLVKFDTGGLLGGNLQAPVFNPATAFLGNAGGITEEKFDELIESNKQLAEEQSKRIDRLEVHQKTNTVTDAQKKQVRQSSIGTL